MRDNVLDNLLELRAELSVGAASRLQMRFTIFETWATTFAIGDPIEVEMDNGVGSTGTVLKAEITGLAVEADVRSTKIVVTAYDKRHRLGNDLVVRVYLDSSYSDIITQVAQRKGLRVTVDDSLSRPRFKHIIQATTDLAFINDIARRTGMECTMDDEELQVHPRTSGSTVTLKLGEALRSFDARYTATERPTGVTVTGWDPASKRTVVGAGTSELTESTNDVPITVQPVAGSFGQRKADVWRGVLTSVAESESWRRASRADDIQRV